MQRCFSHGRVCQEHEILRGELHRQQQMLKHQEDGEEGGGGGGGGGQQQQQQQQQQQRVPPARLRLLVVPEAVEALDTSDGSSEWDEEFSRRFREENLV